MKCWRWLCYSYPHHFILQLHFSAQAPLLHSAYSSHSSALASSLAISWKRTAGPMNPSLPSFWCWLNSFFFFFFWTQPELYYIVLNLLLAWLNEFRGCVLEWWCCWWPSSTVPRFWYSVKTCSSFTCFHQSFSMLGKCEWLSSFSISLLSLPY